MSRDSDRLLVASRLTHEGLCGEGLRLTHCGDPMVLSCSCCSRAVEVPKFCKRKWCPVCAAIRSDEAVERFGGLVDTMRSPLFLTLTAPHSMGDDPGATIRLFIDGVAKMRSLRWFKTKVRGGIGAVEVSTPPSHDEQGAPLPFHGYHVHWHGLLDCDWLSVTIDPPRRGASRKEIEMKAKASQKEIIAQWALCLGLGQAGMFVRRPAKGTLQEVLKYSVTTEALLDNRLPLTPLIQGMRGAKMRAPWGSIRKLHTALIKSGKADSPPMVCECGAEAWRMTPGPPAPSIDQALRPGIPDTVTKPGPRSPTAEEKWRINLAARRATGKALPGMESIADRATRARLQANLNAKLERQFKKRKR